MILVIDSSSKIYTINAFYYLFLLFTFETIFEPINQLFQEIFLTEKYTKKTSNETHNVKLLPLFVYYALCINHVPSKFTQQVLNLIDKFIILKETSFLFL